MTPGIVDAVRRFVEEEVRPAAPALEHADAYPHSRNAPWAGLMRRAFAIDVLACPRCGGRMRVISTVEDPVALRQILAAPTLDRAGRSRPAGRRSHDGEVISSD
jgi:uncharacterized protein YbaR (Trm112 family)